MKVVDRNGNGEERVLIEFGVAMQIRRNGRQKSGLVAERKIEAVNVVRVVGTKRARLIDETVKGTHKEREYIT